MSLFGSIGNFFKKVFDAIMKLLKVLLPILIIVLIIIAIFFPYLLPIIWAWVTTAWAAVGGWIAAAWEFIATGIGTIATSLVDWVQEASFSDVLKMAAGAAVILNPEGVADAAGSVLETIADVASDLFGPALPWLIGGVAWWFLFGRKKDEETVVLVRGDENAETS